MKQLLQNMRDGQSMVVDVPVPQVRPGTALVRISASLVSAGTERMLVDFAGKSLVEKARSRPDLVRQVLDKARREGLLTTVEAAFNKLDQPMTLGYSSAGTIVAVGEGLQGFKVGDRVACAGNHATHAEYDLVPQNQMALIPAEVDFESAAFTTVGAIAMQGFRLAEPQLGEKICVIGLGLLGLLTVRIALAAGCAVFGVDLNPERVEMARLAGATAVRRGEAVSAGMAFSQGRGFDAVIICADTRSNDTVHLAGALARDRGHVISTGVVGLDLPRKLYFEKELHFQVSRSSGPGRWDVGYEENGQDYPYGYVRWTENRNMQSFLELLATKKMDVWPLISHRFKITEAPEAYDIITGKKEEPFLGVLLLYPQEEGEVAQTRIPNGHASQSSNPTPDRPGIGVLGAGLYASATFLPAMQKAGNSILVGVASATGASARHAANRFGFQYASSAENDILTDSKIQVVAILTRHDQHARQSIEALKNGKHVYCEKPLAMNRAELDELTDALQSGSSPLLTVGFNRRFAPLAVRMKAFFNQRSEPLAAHYRVNAGALPLNHWLHDPQQGGGRIIGEGCHFIDFINYLVGSAPVSVFARALPDQGKYNQDNVVMTFTYADGSVGTVSYLANGDKSFAKEYVDVFCGGNVAVLDDYRRLELVKNGKREEIKSLLRQDKGHRSAWETFLNACRHAEEPPIPYAEIWGSHLATFAAVESLKTGQEVKIG